MNIQRVLMGFSVLLGIFSADQISQNIETARLIEQFEVAEVTMEAVNNAYLAADVNIQGNSIRVVESRFADKASIESAKLYAASIEITKSSIMPWHYDAIYAREDFLVHAGAWLDFMHSIQNKEDGKLYEVSAGVRIAPTFLVLKDSMPRMVPWIDFLGIETRVNQMLND